MSNPFKRNLPTDTSIQSLHVSLNRVWDAIEASGRGNTAQPVAPTRVLSASPLVLSGSGSTASDHNSLGGIQGGNTGEYYHATYGEYTGSGTGVFVRANSPALTGVPTAPTPTYLDNSTAIATTAFIKQQPSFLSRVTVSDADYTITQTGGISIAYTALTAGRSINLPSPSTSPGQIVVIADDSGQCSLTNTITVTGTIDGQANRILNYPYASITLESNGVSGYTITANPNPNLSAGMQVQPGFTDLGTGSVTIGTGTYALFTNPYGRGKIKAYSIPGGTYIMTDGVTNYIVANYNNGSPVLQVITDVTLITNLDVIPVFTIYRNGTTLYDFEWDQLGDGLGNKLQQSIVKTQRYRAEPGGLGLGEVATRLVTIGAGKVWSGAVPTVLAAFNSSVNPMIFAYHVAGVWTLSTVTTYNNTQFDDGTNLQTTPGGKYTVNFLYRGVGQDNDAFYVLGNQAHSLGAAQVAQPPGSLPPVISSHCILVGRIIVSHGATTATQIDSAFTTLFTPTAAVDHNSLANLQGGTASEYYHLTSAEYTGTGTGPFVRQTSPALLGTPTAPTAATADNSTTVATTAFVKNQGYLTSALTNPMTTAGDMIYGGTAGEPTRLPIGTANFWLKVVAGNPVWTALASADVTGALGFTPYNATNPSNFITITSVPVVTTTTPLMDGTAVIGASGKWADGAHVHPTDTSRQASYANLTTIGSLANTAGLLRNDGTGVFTYDTTAYLSGTKVDSFNTRTGPVTLSSADVTGALGFTPYNATNPAGYTANTGTVTTVSVASANGFAGTVATPGTTPAITLTTSVTGLLKGNGTAVSAAASADVVSALGYTPVNKAGDTGIGNLSMAALTATSGQFNGSFRVDTSAITTSFIGTGTGSNFQVYHDGSSNVQLVNSGNGGFSFTDGLGGSLTSVSMGALTAATGAFSGVVTVDSGATSHIRIGNNTGGGYFAQNCSLGWQDVLTVSRGGLYKWSLQDNGSGTAAVFTSGLTVNGALSATTGTFSDNVTAPGFIPTSTTLDLSSLDQATWYPVTFSVNPARRTRFRIKVALDSGTVPTWSTHPSGFSVICDWTCNGSGWGTSGIQRTIHSYEYSWSTVSPVGGLDQMNNSSLEVVYLRGGGKYFFESDYLAITPTIQTATYTINSQTVSPTTAIINNVFSAATSSVGIGALSATTGIFSGAVSMGALTATTGTFSSTVTATSFNSITGLSTASPLMDGVATVGTSTLVAREGHIHPTDTSRLGATDQAVDSAKLGGQLPSYYQTALGYTPINKAGDTGIGNLSMAALTATTGTFSGAVSMGALTATTAKTSIYTVATLPAGSEGTRASVSDATTTTFASIVAGGGTNHVPVYHNGTNWIIG